MVECKQTWQQKTYTLQVLLGIKTGISWLSDFEYRRQKFIKNRELKLFLCVSTIKVVESTICSSLSSSKPKYTQYWRRFLVYTVSTHAACRLSKILKPAKTEVVTFLKRAPNLSLRKLKPNEPKAAELLHYGLSRSGA